MSVVRDVNREILSLILLCTVSYSASLCQSHKDAYQLATILDVKRDPNADSADPGTRYDISLKVGDTIYVVLFTQPPGSYGVEHIAGLQKLVLIGNETITFNDILGRSRKAPILSRNTDAGRSNH
jgi:hypothetical protein